MSQTLIESLLIGKIIAEKYRIIERLGAGSMGHVFLAEHIELKKRRAIKILRDEHLTEEVARKRFLREISITHTICEYNEHIIKLYDDYGFDHNIGFFVMEYLEGDDLEARIRQHPKGLPISWSLRIVYDICQAMDVVHQAGVVHRDLKPSNLFLIQTRNQSDFVKIVDFGIARLGKEKTSLTRTGSVLGTPLYMSPEQIIGAQESLSGGEHQGFDGRVDIYSLGCILFELLTGKPPFLPKSSAPLQQMALLRQHLEEPAPSLLSFRPECSKELDAIVQKALAKRPEDRFQTMGAFANAIRSFHRKFDPLAEPFPIESSVNAQSYSAVSTPDLTALFSTAGTVEASAKGADEAEPKEAVQDSVVRTNIQDLSEPSQTFFQKHLVFLSIFAFGGLVFLLVVFFRAKKQSNNSKKHIVSRPVQKKQRKLSIQKKHTTKPVTRNKSEPLYRIVWVEPVNYFHKYNVRFFPLVHHSMNHLMISRKLRHIRVEVTKKEMQTCSFSFDPSKVSKLWLKPLLKASKRMNSVQRDYCFVAIPR